MAGVPLMVGSSQPIQKGPPIFLSPGGPFDYGSPDQGRTKSTYGAWLASNL
jgi:hypothetical protein